MNLRITSQNNRFSEINALPCHRSPAWWQLLRWISNPLEFLDYCTDRYGECFFTEIGQRRHFVFLSNPAAIAQLLTADPALFEVGRANGILRPTLGDNSLLLLDGDRHQRQRQLLMPPFHGERMRAYGQLIPKITHEVMQHWQAGQMLTMRPQMQTISLQVILQTVFGLADDQRSRQLQQALTELLSYVTSTLGFALAFFPRLQRDFGAWSPGHYFLRMKQRVDDLLYAEIRERRAQIDSTRTDILTLLLLARDDAGEAMTDGELRDELLTLLIAGHETTATALSWALYWIHRTPGVRDKLLAELATLGQTPDPTAIARLPYLNAVCSETLRIYPIAFVAASRICIKPITIAGYQFPAESWLTAGIYQVHWREDLYPQPDQFRPERFLERQFSPYEFFPFGGGNRRCIGAAFALYEMKLVLTTILFDSKLTLAEPRPVQPVRRGVTIAPQSGIRMTVESKSCQLGFTQNSEFCHQG
jgi:unspecific monooxygenase